MGALPGMGLGDWDWDAEIAEARRNKQQAALDKVAVDLKVFGKKDMVFLEDKYFAELCKQFKHRVNVVMSTFPHEDGFYKITPKGYLHLQKYLPLPAWEKIKMIKG